MESADRQFIFKESDFEGDQFVAAQFVAKYRKVNSLESLKEQLLQYSNTLKQQLYDIINRDYKDFITISTKLDGVDTRTALLQKPLSELRGNMSSLHEGVIAGMQAIQEKMKNRLEISKRRQVVQTVLQCMDRLDATAAILVSSGLQAGGSGEGAVGGLGDLLQEAGAAPPGGAGLGLGAHSRSARSRLMSALDVKLRASGRPRAALSGGEITDSGLCSTAVVLLQKDVFICSELERASFFLRAADGALRLLWAHCEEGEGYDAADHDRERGQGSEESKGGEGRGKDQPSTSSYVLQQLRSRRGLAEVFRSLDGQSKAHRQALVRRVSSQLSHLLSGAGAEGPAQPEGQGSGGAPLMLQLRRRCFAHCLRALCALGCAAVAEELLRTIVVAPLARSQLTAGRVDGREGRGSYSGLDEALQGVLDGLALSHSAESGQGTSSLLSACLAEGEAVRSYFASEANFADSEGGGEEGVDLVTQGLWMPVAGVLQERCADMFTVSIPGTLSHCYRSVHRFLGKLQNVCGPALSQTIGRRLRKHPLVTAFFAQWRLDLYFQLRCKEVFVRVDRACESALRQGPAAPRRLLDELYPAPVQAGKGGSGGSAENIHGALRGDVEGQLQRYGGVQSPAFTAAALELRANLHPSVLLDPLAGKFLTLILRTLLRVEAHVAVSAGLCTPSFPSKDDTERLRATCTGTGAGAGDGAPAAAAAVPSAQGNATTPAGKKGASQAAAAASTPVSSQQHSAQTAWSPVVLSYDELAMLCGDVLCLEGWVEGEFSTAAASALVLRGTPAWAEGAAAVDLRAVDAVRSALRVQVRRLAGAREAVWERATGLIAAECKKALAAVRTAVVGRYRMTNKPPPDAPSGYVDTVLAPLRKFLDQFAPLAGRLSTAPSKDAAAASGQVSGTGSTDQALVTWLGRVVEEVSGSFVEQVSALIETVKQMDSTLQRRNKQQASGQPEKGATMTDSEKIALQIKLDIEAFGKDIAALGLNPEAVNGYVSLKALSFE